MQSTVLARLRAREFTICERWRDLLRAEPVQTPLGHPDALMHLIAWTLEEIFRDLATGDTRRRADRHPAGISDRPSCACGRNPLLAYFEAARQALREALVLVQAELAALAPVERDAALAELNLVLERVARREIEAFCGVCQFRGTSCRPMPDLAVLT